MKLVSEQNKTLDEHEQKVMWRREARYIGRGNTTKPTLSVTPLEDLIPKKLSLSYLFGPLWL